MLETDRQKERAEFIEPFGRAKGQKLFREVHLKVLDDQ